MQTDLNHLLRRRRRRQRILWVAIFSMLMALAAVVARQCSDRFPATHQGYYPFDQKRAEVLKKKQPTEP